MLITPLGHTEFLVDIANNDGENVRILVDTWLSDYAVGDLMERTIKVRLDPSKLETIDAIYISHAHTDHLDPYTLYNLLEKGGGTSETSDGGLAQKKSETPIPLSQSDIPLCQGGKRPLFLLPFTLAYLVPLLREYLGDIRIEILTSGKPFFLRGIEITGYMFPQSEITNEDDVMMLALANDSELLFAEIDTLPEDDILEVQKELYSILTRKEYDTICYLASRNELAGQLPLLDLPEKKRGNFRSQYIAQRKEAMYFSYQKYEYEEYAHFPNIYEIPGFCRGFIGQGIAYPRTLSEELFSTEIFPLDEIVSMEADIARECSYEFTQKALLPGRQYKVESGTIEQGRKECPIGELLKSTSSSLDNTVRESKRIYALGPLFPRHLSQEELCIAKRNILEVLNTRFLPYWSASPTASLREAIVRNAGTYRIMLKVNNQKGHGEIQKEEGTENDGSSLSLEGSLGRIIFEYSTTRPDFIEVPYDEGMLIDEEYWLLDVLDFLDGRQDLYSNFWHTLSPKKVYRLWTCLGANFCNNDIILKKYRLHFERARSGETSETFFDAVRGNLTA